MYNTIYLSLHANWLRTVWVDVFLLKKTKLCKPRLGFGSFKLQTNIQKSLVFSVDNENDILNHHPHARFKGWSQADVNLIIIIISGGGICVTLLT